MASFSRSVNDSRSMPFSRDRGAVISLAPLPACGNFAAIFSKSLQYRDLPFPAG
jgi:hypothetical protein